MKRQQSRVKEGRLQCLDGAVNDILLWRSVPVTSDTELLASVFLQFISWEGSSMWTKLLTLSHGLLAGKKTFVFYVLCLKKQFLLYQLLLPPKNQNKTQSNQTTSLYQAKKPARPPLQPWVGGGTDNGWIFQLPREEDVAGCVAGLDGAVCFGTWPTT